jgi:outer membrane assembly lipoprotein YfiO
MIKRALFNLPTLTAMLIVILSFGSAFAQGSDSKISRKDRHRIAQLTESAAPGRDGILFKEAARLVRKGNYEGARLLFNTIVTTYPDSAYLPMARLAIGDSFYLEGSPNSLVQAGHAYQEWLTFFPANPLTDRVMLKIAECEMRQMGRPNVEIVHGRKAEQQLKVLLQQYPNTSVKDQALTDLHTVQDYLAMHNLQVAEFYMDRYRQRGSGIKGAQFRLLEIVQKYAYFEYMDNALFDLGVTYLDEEEPDEAAKYFQRIARDYPNSEYAARAREQLRIMGAPVPEAGLAAVERPRHAKVSWTTGLVRELWRRPEINVDKSGVLISRDRNATSDLIDLVIKNQGEIR